LLTGRKHQIRVHALWLGHRIVGDKIYGHDESLYLEFINDGWTPRLREKLAHPRHALHAFFLHLWDEPSGWKQTFRAPPTEDLYDAVARWPLQRLAISGCEVDQPTVWYVAVTLERQWLADGRSPPLQQRRFQLTANLRQSNVSLMQMALGTRVSIPHNYLCCGVYRDFVVPELTRSLALRVEITVHEGSLSAIYLKHQTCARSPDDIGADESCIGRCQMQWLTTYDPFTLAPAYATAASVTVPMGIASADMRAAGGWYISIGSAFDGRVANFSLIAELVEAPVVDRFVPLDEDGAAAARCGRFCVVLDEDVTPIIDEDEDVIFGIGRSSSAPRRGSGSAGELLPVALALTAAIIVAWSGGVAAA
jgi:hypothetical protein